jgi:hypothetical protein
MWRILEILVHMIIVIGAFWLGVEFGESRSIKIMPLMLAVVGTGVKIYMDRRIRQG